MVLKKQEELHNSLRDKRLFMKIISESFYKTRDIGKKIGALLQKGDVVCLCGDLGSGKTAFVSGIAKSLMLDDYIVSPTFTIVNEYDTNPPLFHFDVYRVNDPEELYMIGFEEYFFDKGIVVVEWADLILDILPKEYMRVDIHLNERKDSRILNFKAVGNSYEEILDNLKGMI